MLLTAKADTETFWTPFEGDASNIHQTLQEVSSPHRIISQKKPLK